LIDLPLRRSLRLPKFQESTIGQPANLSNFPLTDGPNFTTSGTQNMRGIYSVEQLTYVHLCFFAVKELRTNIIDL